MTDSDQKEARPTTEMDALASQILHWVNVLPSMSQEESVPTTRKIRSLVLEMATKWQVTEKGNRGLRERVTAFWEELATTSRHLEIANQRLEYHGHQRVSPGDVTEQNIDERVRNNSYTELEAMPVYVSGAVRSLSKAFRDAIGSDEGIDARPTFEQTWMEVAHVMASRGSCERRKVGAVIVSENNRILSTGWNGAPSGQPHCSEVGCIIDAAGRCKRAIHAEANAIISAANNGVRIGGSTLYCTDRPCEDCVKMLINAGVVEVIYDREYSIPESIAERIDDMVKRSGMVMTKA